MTNQMQRNNRHSAPTRRQAKILMKDLPTLAQQAINK